MDFISVFMTIASATFLFFDFWNNGLQVTHTDFLWHHWACVYNSTVTTGPNRFIYRDGILLACDRTGSYLGSGTSYIGTTPWTISGDVFGGSLDEMRVWNTARTQCEIQTYMACEIPSASPGLLSNYHFNQGSPNLNNTSETILLDAAGSFTGTLNNFALTGTVSNYISPGAVALGYTTITTPTASISVSGNGNPVLNNSSSTSTVNLTDFGITSSSTFVIQNGSGTLNIGTPILMGGDASEFSVTVLPSGSLSASGTTSFVVAFTPTTSGIRSTNVYIVDNDCNIAIFNFVIQATAPPASALRFDGTDDYIDLPSTNIPTGNSDFTTEFWVKINSTQTGHRWVSSLGSAVSGSLVTIGYDGSFGNKIRVHHFGPDLIASTASITPNVWTHVAINYRGSTYSSDIFINGNYIETLNFGVPLTIPANPSWQVGSFASNSTYCTDIDLDELRTWNRALCAPEIQNNMYCEIPATASGLVANFHFNQGAAVIDNSAVTTLTDASGSTNTGTLANFALTGTVSNWCSPGAVTSGSSCSIYANPEINLLGNGVSIVDGNTTPSSSDNTDFLSVCVNTVTVRTFSIQNTGGSPLSISNISLSGAGATSFSIGSLSPASPIAAGGSATFAVTFTPTTSGVQTATLDINSNDCDEALYDVVITGTANALPTVTASASSSVICNTFSTSVIGLGADTYTWTGAIAASDGIPFTPSITSTYTVTGTNTLTGCASTNLAVQTITVNALPVLTVATTSSAICLGNTTTLTVNGADTYTWNPGTLNGSSITPSPALTTTYSVTGTNTLTGCTSMNLAVQVITVNAIPSVTAGAPGLTICAGQQATLVGSGANSYTWNPGGLTGTTVNPSPASNTDYTLTGTSLAGCTSTNLAVVSITINTLPTVGINPLIVSICSGASASLSGTGASTYTWNPGGLTGGTITPAPLSNTAYTVVGTSTAGCTSTNIAMQNVTVNALPVLTVAAVSSTICLGNTATLSAIGADTYTWSPGALNGSSITPSPVLTTTYSVIGTNVLTGCTSTNLATRVITVNAIPSVTASAPVLTVCAGQQATLVGSGANSYTWNPGGLPGTTVNPSPTSNTDYTLTGTSLAGCTSTNLAVVSITANPLPTVGISPLLVSICSGASASLSGTGANTYTWNPGGLTGGTITPAPLSNTSYTVVGTSTAGCTSTNIATQNVTVNALPTVTAGASNSVICNSGTTTLIATGADTFTWTPGNLPNGSSVAPTVNTTYTVVGTNILTGCTSTNLAVQTISVNPSPTIALSVINSTICAGDSPTLTASNAASYTWNPGAYTTAVISPTLSATTTFTLIGASPAGCLSSNMLTQTIVVNALPIVTAGASSMSVCLGYSTSVYGGGANSYAWTGGLSNNTSFTPTATNSYTVTGTDLNNCTNTATIIITVDPIPSVTANITSTAICQGSSLTLSGNGASTYTWTGGINDNVAFAPAASQNYSLTGISPAGCTSTNAAVVSVTVNALPSLSTTVSNSVICIGNTVSVNAMGASTYTWTNGLSNATAFTPSLTSDYTVTGEDANGCQNTANLSITVNSLPTVTISAPTPTICEAQTVTLTASGATNYTWSSSQSGADIVISPTATSNYSVIGTDANGCSNFATFTQSVSPCLGTLTAIASKTDVSCGDKHDGAIVITTTNSYSSSVLSFIWSSSTVCPANACDTLSNLYGGTYNVTVKVTYTINNILVKQDSVLVGPIIVRNDNGPCQVRLFSGISPDGDGVNDTWQIENISEFPKNKVTIFNRWGTKVFEVEGYDNVEKSWPLAGESSKLQPNTYFYLIDLGNGSPLIKGWVELMKN